MNWTKTLICIGAAAVLAGCGKGPKASFEEFKTKAEKKD